MFADKPPQRTLAHLPRIAADQYKTSKSSAVTEMAQNAKGK
jgi:hypothetical protein